MAKPKTKSATLKIEAHPTRKPKKTAKTAVRSTKSLKSAPPKATKTIVEPIMTIGGLSKQAMLITLMRRTEGATLEDLTSATGWQSHSVRGMISGVVKKRLGFIIATEKEERGRVYRITGERR